MLEKCGAFECKLGGQSAASGTAAIGSEFSGTGSGSDMILRGVKVVGSGSGVVEVESMCSDIYISRTCV